MPARRLLVIGLVVVVGAALLLTYRKRQERLPALKRTDDLLQSLASEAVDSAQRSDHVYLDYSVESLKAVDEILDGAHLTYLKNPGSVSVSGLSSTYGAYVGEVIRRNEQRARWGPEDTVLGERSRPLNWGATLRVYPFVWCRERILKGDSFSLWASYSEAKELASHGVL